MTLFAANFGPAVLRPNSPPPANPVDKGGIVSLFGTGAGESNPKGIDVRLAVEPFAKPVLPVTVELDAQPAEVLYTGHAPGLVPGIFDLSIRIPPNTRSGVAPPRPASPSLSANNLPKELFTADLAPF